jgi:hypothetical protein
LCLFEIRFTNRSQVSCLNCKESLWKVIIPNYLYATQQAKDYISNFTLREEFGFRVFESGVLRKIFGPKWQEVTGDWRKLHNDELCDLYFRTNVIRMRGIIWARDVARMERREMSTEFLWRNIKERDHSEDLGVNGRIRLKLFLKFQ